jgi:hypothetical protein
VAAVALWVDQVGGRFAWSPALARRAAGSPLTLEGVHKALEDATHAVLTNEDIPEIAMVKAQQEANVLVRP